MTRARRADQRRALALLRAYVRERGWAALAIWGGPAVVRGGVDLTAWVQKQRAEHSRGRARDVAAALEALPGWEWTKERQRQRLLLLALRDEVERRGWLSFRRGCSWNVEVAGMDLRRWVRRCRKDHRRGRLTQWLTRELEAIPGWTWAGEAATPQTFVELLRRVARRQSRGAHGSVVEEIVHLTLFLSRARKRQAGGELPTWLTRALERMPGWTWRNPHRQR